MGLLITGKLLGLTNSLYLLLDVRFCFVEAGNVTSHRSLIFVQGSCSLPSSMNVLEDHNDGVQTQEAITERPVVVGSKESQFSPGAYKKQDPVTPQSPLTKNLVYENIDVVKAQNPNSFTASCPDITLDTCYNTNDLVKSKKLQPPSDARLTPTPDSVVSEVPPYTVQLESTPVVSSSTEEVSSHTYCNITDLVSKRTVSKQPLKAVTHTKIGTSTGTEQALFGDNINSVDVIQNQSSHMSTKQILTSNDGDTTQGNQTTPTD